MREHWSPTAKFTTHAYIMVLILDGRSEIDVHLIGKVDKQNCKRHLFISTVVADLICFPRETWFPSHVRNVF